VFDELAGFNDKPAVFLLYSKQTILFSLNGGQSLVYFFDVNFLLRDAIKITPLRSAFPHLVKHQDCK